MDGVSTVTLGRPLSGRHFDFAMSHIGWIGTDSASDPLQALTDVRCSAGRLVYWAAVERAYASL